MAKEIKGREFVTLPILPPAGELFGCLERVIPSMIDALLADFSENGRVRLSISGHVAGYVEELRRTAAGGVDAVLSVNADDIKWLHAHADMFALAYQRGRQIGGISL